MQCVVVCQNQNHTCTHGTHFENTTGFPLPVLNPIHQLAGKGEIWLLVKTYAVYTNALENSKLVHKYVKIYYLSMHRKVL